MKVFIAGIDGYLGWPLALYLKGRGHIVAGADSFLRRDLVDEIKGWSATPIAARTDRMQQDNIDFIYGEMRAIPHILNSLRSFNPDAIVHLAEMPSAPYSMIDAEHAVFTHTNNLTGTLNILHAMRDVCPDAHLVKLGSMGEYGTPNVDIPEGDFVMDFRARMDRMPFPKQAGSWYHQTKVHDSNNIMMACRLWGLKSTDIMQGVVFGTRTDEMGDDERLLTRFDFDQCFGTVINRFCAQAVIGEPLTLYGSGHQKRGFLPLRDSMQCLGLAIENPPGDGEYRVFNQFQEVYELLDLAWMVLNTADDMGINSEIRHVDNPRIEAEDHYYNPDHQKLLDLGYQPTTDIEAEIAITLKDLIKYKGRIEAKKDVLMPDIRWDGKKCPTK